MVFGMLLIICDKLIVVNYNLGLDRWFMLFNMFCNVGSWVSKWMLINIVINISSSV